MPDDNKALEDLRAALNAANRRATQAEARATELDGRLRTETGSRFAAQEAQVDSSITSTERTLDSLQAQQASLYAEGKLDEAARAGREMAEAAATLQGLRSQKTWLETQKQQVEQQQTNQNADPYANYPQEQRDWIDRHPEFRSDSVFRGKVLAAAQGATHLKGLRENSPEWFAEVERTVYPERQSPAPNTDTNAGGDEFIDDRGEQIDPNARPDTSPMAQQHNRETPTLSPTPEPPAMRLDLNPERPQERAIGRGGNAQAAFAAAPTRMTRTGQAVQRGEVSLSPEEVETALAVVGSIEPDIEDPVGSGRFRRKTPLEMGTTYYQWAHSPSNSNNGRNGTRRGRTWAREAIIA